MQNKLLLLWVGIIFSQNLPNDTDPEDAYNEQGNLVDDFSLDENYSRIRITPEPEDEKWHYIQSLTLQPFSLGWRFDKQLNDTHFNNAKFYISKNNQKYKLLVGNIRIELGQGLLFSSLYGRFKTYENGVTIASNKYKISPDLTSFSDTEIQGLSFNYQFNKSFTSDLVLSKRNTIAIFQFNTIPSTPRITFTTLNQQLNGSVAGEIKSSYLNVNTEVSFKNNEISYIVNFYSKTKLFQWLIQYRKFSLNRENIIGKPLTNLDGKNEGGILATFQLNFNKFVISTWLDIFTQNQVVNGQPTNWGLDNYFGIKYKISTSQFLSFRVRSKKIIDEFILVENNLEKQYWCTLNKNKILLKYHTQLLKFVHQYLIVNPEIGSTEYGNLSTASFKIIKHPKIQAMCGFHYYTIESWNSRLYAYEPGIKGEFRIRSFYNNGITVFSKLEWNPYPSLIISARISFDKASHIETNFQQNAALQMDIVF